MQYLLGSIVVLSGFVQGGYFPSAFLIAGILLSCFCVKSFHRSILPSEYIFWMFSCWYILASLANGYNSASLAQACLPTVCACFLSCYLSLSKLNKQTVLSLIIVGSGIYAILGILAYSGIIFFQASTTANRLQFPFQYANAAGAWYAAIALLCQDREERISKILLLPMTVSLYLTCSIGALSIYTLLQCVRLLLLREKAGVWKEVIITNAGAAIFALAFYFISGLASVLILITLCLTGVYWTRLVIAAKNCKLHWLCLVGFGCGIVAILYSQRLLSGLRTFAERLTQIRDGCAMLWAHPIFGVGAGNWEWFYPYYQSAQYTSTVVHSSVIQIGVDAGFLAVGLAILFCFLSWRQEREHREVSLAAALLLLHSLGDFDFQFFPICALTFVLLYAEQEPEDSKQHILLSLLSVGFALLLSFMFCTEQMVKHFVRQLNGRNGDAVITQYAASRPLFGENPDAKRYYIMALSSCGQSETILQETAGTLDLQMLLLRAQEIYQLGNPDEACELLLSELEKRPYEVELFEQTAQRLKNWSADRKYIEIYNAIAREANQSCTFLGTMQGNQVEIEKID